MIATRQFKPPTAAYPSRIARRLLRRRLWLLSVPVAVIAAGAFTDVRVAIIGFMLLLLAYPMLMTLAVLGHAASPATARRSTADRARITDDGDITLSKTDEDGAVHDVETAKICYVECDRRLVTVNTGTSADDIILIPADAFESDDLRLILKKFQINYDTNL